jgi:hypothetical protein
MLTVDEKIELSHLESEIEAGRQAFHRSIIALKQVYDRQLWKDAGSFKDYWQSKWAEQWRFDWNYAYKLVEAAEVIQNLNLAGCTTVQPENERQTRPLKPLLPEQQVEAWEAAVAIAPAGKPTSTEVTRAAAAVKAPKGETFTLGQETTVLDESSSLYGQSVRVGQVEGVIVHCETLNGEAIAQPFLANELATESPRTAVDSTWKPTPKIDRVEGLEVSLEVERERVKVLEAALQRLVAAARAGNLSNQLLAEAESLLA